MKRLQERDNFAPNRHDNDVWGKIPSLGTEPGQRQNFNEYELVQDEYLNNLGTTDNIEQTHTQERLGNINNRQMRQLYRETKTDKIKKLRREIEFLERGMQTVRTRLSRIQQYK